VTQPPSPNGIVSELTQLHEFKDRRYKDAWRKRGELIGIFSNIARKYDRLVVARNEDDPDEEEPRADTAADLCVYSVKYITWLIEHDPAAAEAIDAADSELWSGRHGHAAVSAALKQLAAEQTAPPANLSTAFDAVAAPFTTLEQILVDEQEVPLRMKATLAWELAGAALAYLWRLALDDPQAWKRFTSYVANPV
jgi:hypothetical protein